MHQPKRFKKILELDSSTLQFLILVIILNQATASDSPTYCHKNCQDYFPGPQFQDCIQQHADFPSCGTPPVALGFIGLFVIVSVVLVCISCIRCCKHACGLGIEERNRLQEVRTSGQRQRRDNTAPSGSGVTIHCFEDQPPPPLYANCVHCNSPPGSDATWNHHWSPVSAPYVVVLPVEEPPPSYESIVVNLSVLKKETPTTGTGSNE